jgi:hypothetical protein
MTTIPLLPHRGHLNRLSSDDNGKARPRVQPFGQARGNFSFIVASSFPLRPIHKHEAWHHAPRIL